MATIYDVARLAGVSPSTVSRVLNDIKVREDLAGRVRKAAAMLSYEPNRAARNLRRQKSEIVALIVPDIENPYFTALARGVENQCRADGYSVMLGNSDEDMTKEAEYLDIALLELTAGVILAHASKNTDISALLQSGRPVVAVDRAPERSQIDSVSVDNQAAGRLATALLCDRGFSRIACVTGPYDVETATLRAAGWKAELNARGMRPGPLIHSDYRYDGGHDAVQELLSGELPPDAIVVTNNLMAAGALHALDEPGRIGLASIGDLPYASLEHDGVDVVPLPARKLGELAAQVLIDRIRGDTSPPRSLELPITR